jgi:hypothetical protein
MKFYSKIVNKPESVITEVKDGLKIVSRKMLCQFWNGVCEVEDPEVIKKLQAHPERFRTDKPWPTNYWQNTEEGIRLLKRGEALNIDTRHIRKEYLIKMIAEKEKEKEYLIKMIAEKEKELDIPADKVEDPNKSKALQYQELLTKAKTMGIKTNRRKKEDILNDIKTKEVIIHG